MSKAHLNQLVLMADEHSRKVLRCYGNSVVDTPNLDRLASSGTLFSAAYTNSPICVPARAAFATGKFIHRTGHWDNAFPYCGSPESWGHKLQRVGHRVGSIGKLHYRDEHDAVGLDFEKVPMHVVNGVGDVLGCIREPLPPRWRSRELAEKLGSGETSYTKYDRTIASEASSWIMQNAVSEEPWVLFVSMVSPHFPLIAPESHFDRYAGIDFGKTKSRQSPEHPWHSAMRACLLYDNFTEERTRMAITAYFALVTFMDEQMGLVLDALEKSGAKENTQIIYTSDHGDNLGARDLWGKGNFYEESVGVPLIIAGPSVPADKFCRTPVSLVDIYPTILETAGIEAPGDIDGKSLVVMANQTDDEDRIVFSEYHAVGAASGAFMLRMGRWKLMYYVGMPPQLFDLIEDPEEMCDKAFDKKFARILDDMTEHLFGICNPFEVHDRAIQDQRARVEQHGGPEAVLSKGGFGATPPPGEEAKYSA